jgi:hypothetical protein
MLAQGLAHQGADGQVGHIVVVHDIEMDDVGASGQHIIDFLAQLGEVGGQDGGGDKISGHGSVSPLVPEWPVKAPGSVVLKGGTLPQAGGIFIRGMASRSRLHTGRRQPTSRDGI